MLAFLAQAAIAQQSVDRGQLAHVRALLRSSRPELTQEQFALLSGKLTRTEQAYAELLALTEAGAGTTTVAETAGAILGGAAELLPLLIAFWPATAHAPGNKEEKPQVRAAREKLDEKLKELSQAAREVDEARKARCPPCTSPLPPHRVDADHTHHPCPGKHVHYWVWEQNPTTCQCFMKDRLACL